MHLRHCLLRLKAYYICKHWCKPDLNRSIRMYHGMYPACTLRYHSQLVSLLLGTFMYIWEHYLLRECSEIPWWDKLDFLFIYFLYFGISKFMNTPFENDFCLVCFVFIGFFSWKKKYKSKFWISTPFRPWS